MTTLWLRTVGIGIGLVVIRKISASEQLSPSQANRNSCQLTFKGGVDNKNKNFSKKSYIQIVRRPNQRRGALTPPHPSLGGGGGGVSSGILPKGIMSENLTPTV